jgi:ribosome modulation factor
MLNKKEGSMKRQKRDRIARAHNRGYQAGVTGKSKEDCPYQAVNYKEQWLGGWRDARTDVLNGLF